MRCTHPFNIFHLATKIWNIANILQENYKKHPKNLLHFFRKSSKIFQEQSVIIFWGFSVILWHTKYENSVCCLAIQWHFGCLCVFMDFVAENFCSPSLTDFTIWYKAYKQRIEGFCVFMFLLQNQSFCLIFCKIGLYLISVFVGLVLLWVILSC